MRLDCGYYPLHRITLACYIDLLPITGNHHAILANAMVQVIGGTPMPGLRKNQAKPKFSYRIEN